MTSQLQSLLRPHGLSCGLILDFSMVQEVFHDWEVFSSNVVKTNWIFAAAFLSLQDNFKAQYHCVCNSHKSRTLAQGQFAVKGKKQGKHREFENQI